MLILQLFFVTLMHAHLFIFWQLCAIFTTVEFDKIHIFTLPVKICFVWIYSIKFTV